MFSHDAAHLPVFTALSQRVVTQDLLYFVDPRHGRGGEVGKDIFLRPYSYH